MKQPKLIKYVDFYNTNLGIGVILATLVSLVVIILDVIGISLFIPVLTSLVSSDQEFQISLFAKSLDNTKLNFLLRENERFLFIYLIIIIFILKSLVHFIHGFYIAKLRSVISYKLRTNYISQYSKTSYVYSKNLNSGYIVGLLGEQIFKISTSVIFYLQFWATAIAVLCYVFVGTLASFNVGFYIACSGIFLFFVYRYLNQKIGRISQIFTYNSNVFASKTLQLTKNIKYLISTNSTITFENLADASAEKAANDDRKIGILTAISNSIKEPIILTLVTLVIFIESIKMNNPASEILLSVVFFYRAFNSAISCQNFYQRFLEMTGSIDEYLASYNRLESNLEKDQGSHAFEFYDQIKLIDVSVVEGGNTILDGIDLTIKNKENIAIKGESGAGKSTLLNVLTLVQPLARGNLTIGGVERDNIDKNLWRKKIGFVTQEPMIFDGSIKDNILLKFDDEQINADNYKKLVSICEATGLTQISKNIEQVLEYFVGENGSNLSGGQRQRLCIARELYHDKDLLILDEPTSALDSESEASIMEIIENLKGIKTIILVTHNEAILSGFDRVLVMKQGSLFSDIRYAK